MAYANWQLSVCASKTPQRGMVTGLGREVSLIDRRNLLLARGDQVEQLLVEQSILHRQSS